MPPEQPVDLRVLPLELTNVLEVRATLLASVDARSHSADPAERIHHHDQLEDPAHYFTPSCCGRKLGQLPEPVPVQKITCAFGFSLSIASSCNTSGLLRSA